MRDAHALVHEVLSLELPTLGICFGMQALASALGGSVCSMVCKEYGPTTLRLCGPPTVGEEENPPLDHCVVNMLRPLLLSTSSASSVECGVDECVSGSFSVYMSHGDSVAEIPQDFVVGLLLCSCVVVVMVLLLSVRQAVSQSVSQSVSQPVSQSVSQSASHCWCWCWCCLLNYYCVCVCVCVYVCPMLRVPLSVKR
jgi:Glutamine amidotransferase class-I